MNSVAIAMAVVASIGLGDVNREELLCLSKNVYFEARGLKDIEQAAVAHVTLNRIDDTQTICEVVYEKGQFTWTKRERSIRDEGEWRKSVEIAYKVLKGVIPDPTHGATFFHEKYVHPSWSRKFKLVADLHHLFYSESRP